MSGLLLIIQTIIGEIIDSIFTGIIEDYVTAQIQDIPNQTVNYDTIIE